MIDGVRTTLAPLAGDTGFVRVTTLREASLVAHPDHPPGSGHRGAGPGARDGRSLRLYRVRHVSTDPRDRHPDGYRRAGAAVLRPGGARRRPGGDAGALIGLALIGVAFRFMSGMIFATWTLDPLTVAGVLAVFSLATLGAQLRAGPPGGTTGSDEGVESRVKVRWVRGFERSMVRVRGCEGAGSKVHR